jgi:hypothetical protein
MRVAAVMVLLAAVLAAGSPAALAQDAVSRAASEVPSPLFEPPPDGVPAGTGTGEDGARTPILVAVGLLAAAAVVGFYTGSSNRTRRS